uniref:Exo-alpha-sialidase n=1 Tax=Caldilinea aerophila TaxID=133453 RepID=A0A7C1FHN8_9CHLR
MRWKWLLAFMTFVVFAWWQGQSLSAAPRAQDSLPVWGAPTPVTVDDWPSLQSEPSIALAGERTLVAWIDARNAAPDLYTALWQEGQAIVEARATNLTPHFDVEHPFGAAAIVEANGRAFAVFADDQQVRLVRYNPATNRWGAPIQVTQGLDDWIAVARFPQIAGDGAGDLVIVWEDFRNLDWRDDWRNSKGSDIYVTRCNGIAMTCDAVNIKLNSDNGRGDQRRPRIARRGAQVAVVWEDHRDYGAEAPQVYFTLSNDGGRTWGPDVRISRPSATPGRLDSATRPAVAFADDGSLFAVWEHHAGAATAPADIYVARWNGSGWDAPQRVDAASPRVRSLAPVIAGGAAGLFVAWQDYRNGSSNPDIYAARWNGGGWEEQPVTTAPGMQIAPALAAEGERVRLVWQDARNGDHDVYMASWQGAGWSQGTPINSAAERSPYQMAPSLANFNGTTHLVFLDNRKGYNELWSSALPLGATTWTSPMRLPTWGNAGHIASHGAHIAVDSAGRIHAVWSEYLWPYGRHILYSVYEGGRWSDPKRLSGEEDDGRERYRPAIAVRNGVVAVVWNEFRWDGQAWTQLYATWNAGAGWSPPEPVLPGAIVERWALPTTIALSDNQIFVAWDAWEGNGRGRLMMARRNLQGGGWSYTQISPTVNSDWCFQQYPQMRSDAAGRLHVVWSGCALRHPPDEWPHDSYIFYATSSDGGITFSEPLRVGLTIAQDDEEYHNNTVSRPTLAVGPDSEVMVLYPSRVEGSWNFYAALVRNGAVVAAQQLGEPTTNWAAEGDYEGRWYEGDSAGAIVYDALQQRYIAVFPTRSNGRSPTLVAVMTEGVSLDLSQKIYLPAVRK